MVRFFLSISVLLFSRFMGCRTTSPVILNEHAVSYSEVQEIARSHQARIHSMAGEGRISIETPQSPKRFFYAVTPKTGFGSD